MTLTLFTQISMVIISIIGLSVAIKKVYRIAIAKSGYGFIHGFTEEKAPSLIVLFYLLISIAGVLTTVFALCENKTSGFTYTIFWISFVLNSLILFYAYVIMLLVEKIQF